MNILTEEEAELLLEKHGFLVVERELVRTKREIDRVSIKFPWAMKISSKHIVHKAKIGGTVLNIRSVKEAKLAFDKLSAIPNYEGVLVQKMISGEELILGLKKTPEFGLVILVGSGGSNVEQEKDVSFRVVPIKEQDAEAMIKELKVYNNLRKQNLAEVKKCMLKLSNFALKNKDLTELDINPLMVNKTEAIIADARVVFN